MAKGEAFAFYRAGAIFIFGPNCLYLFPEDLQRMKFRTYVLFFLLCVGDYPKVFEAELQAVERGELSEERIDQSVRRVLRLRRQAR